MDNPNDGDGGDGSKWNYALLVPMVGLAAFRWIWSKKFQMEMALQSQKHEEEREHLKLECDALNNKISGFHKALKEGKEQEHKALKVLDKVQDELAERQDEFCSIFLHHSRRVRREKDLLAYTAKEPLLENLQMEKDLGDIFNNDRSCADYLNTDRQKNGCLMWLYLRHWKVQLALQKHKRAEAAILDTQTKK